MAQARILLLGDSIRMGYQPRVAQALQGRAEVWGPEQNCGDSRRYLEQLESWLEREADVIHFNCGLHDLKLPREASAAPGRPDAHQVPLAEYARNLERIVARLQQTRARLLWASTTPVLFARHREKKEFDRREEDVAAYNTAARAVMERAGITVNDLHAVLVAGGVEDCLGPDGVHMTEQGNALLQEAVCSALLP